MKTIIFIESQRQGTSFEIIKDAYNEGYKTVLFTTNSNFLLKRKNYTHINKVFYIEKINNIDIINNIIDNNLKNDTIGAVISVIEEYMHLSVELHNLYCNKKIDGYFYKNISNKLNVRNILGISKYNLEYSSNKNDIIKFPFIIKATNSSGSKDVHFIKDEKDYENLIIDNNFIIEEYIDSKQYLVEIIVENSKILKYFVLEQDITFYNNFIVDGYSFENFKDKQIEYLIVSLIKKFKIMNASFHIEIRKKNGIYKIIEINSRTSGGCITNIIEFGTGFKITKWIINNYLGKEYEYKPKKQLLYARYKVSNFNGIVTKITGKNQILNDPDVLELFVRKIKNKEVSLPTSMGKRYAYVIVTDNSIEKAKEKAVKCIEILKFHSR
ncbi:MAG: ATP-grasp domain-containing protein [Bacilli bacterium]